jgi:hypothetical protein
MMTMTPDKRRADSLEKKVDVAPAVDPPREKSLNKRL